MDNNPIKYILSFPTVIQNNHESLYRSYHILEYVLEMINRGDSIECINEMVEYLQTKKDN